MAAGTFTIYDKALLNVYNATGLLDPANTFKWTLHTNAYVPSISAHEVYADLTGELPTGAGYTLGGVTLGSDGLTLTGSVVKFTGAAAAWTAAGGSIPAWRYAVLRASGTLNGKIDPIVGYFIGDIGPDTANPVPADTAATTDTNTLTITPNANGIVAATKVP